MGSKLILIFAIAKLLEPAEVGMFGLMLATVTFSVLVIGADYYTYAHRELLARKVEGWSFVIQHQIKAQLMLYVLLLPLQLLLFIFGLMKWEYALWFFSLLIFEHIAQEINRLLVVMQKQLIASWVLFIRMGGWVLIVIPLMFLNESLRNIETLYTAWLLGGGVAIIFGGSVIRKSLPDWNKVKTDYTWLKKGFKIGGLFLLATLCFRGLVTFDRYAVEALSSVDMLGVYVFYISIVMGVYNILDPAVFSFLYPRLLQSYQMKEKEKYLKIFKELVMTTIAISALLAVVIWFITPIIISWLDKPIYTLYLDNLVLLIMCGFVFAIGHIPHYGLYAMKADKWIIAAHISAILVFYISLTQIQLKDSISTVSLALLLAFGFMAFIKTIGLIVARHQSKLLSA